MKSVHLPSDGAFLRVGECGIVGHSMGGGVGVHVAAARAEVVSVLVLVEGVIGGHGEDSWDAESEDGFVEHVFPEMLETQARQARAQPRGLPAAHLGITRLVEPRAIYREDASIRGETDPPIRSLLRQLPMPRWYLQGAFSDPEPDLQRDLQDMGVGWRVVPHTGHAMGLQNPAGLAQVVSETLTAPVDQRG